MGGWHVGHRAGRPQDTEEGVSVCLHPSSSIYGKKHGGWLVLNVPLLELD